MVILFNRIPIPMSSKCSSINQIYKFTRKKACLQLQVPNNFPRPLYIALFLLTPVLHLPTSSLCIPSLLPFFHYSGLITSTDFFWLLGHWLSSQALTSFFHLIYRFHEVLGRKMIYSNLRTIKSMSQVCAFCLSN